MSKVLPVLSLASMNKVAIVNDSCACKPFLHGVLLNQFLYWVAGGAGRGYPTAAQSVPPHLEQGYLHTASF